MPLPYLGPRGVMVTLYYGESVNMLVRLVHYHLRPARSYYGLLSQHFPYDSKLSTIPYPYGNQERSTSGKVMTPLNPRW